MTFTKLKVENTYMLKNHQQTCCHLQLTVPHVTIYQVIDIPPTPLQYGHHMWIRNKLFQNLARPLVSECSIVPLRRISSTSTQCPAKERQLGCVTLALEPDGNHKAQYPLFYWSLFTACDGWMLWWYAQGSLHPAMRKRKGSLYLIYCLIQSTATYNELSLCFQSQHST